jgi:integrase
MRHFFCFVEESSIEVPKLKDNDFFQFIQIASSTKKGSMYRVVRAVKIITEYMKRHGLADLKADFSMVQLKAAPIRMVEPFSRFEISQIMDCIDTESSIGIRDKAILLLAFETGLRAADIIKLRQTDINWRKAEIHVTQSKTGKPLTLPLNGTAMNAVADYILKARPENGAGEIFLRSKSPYEPFKTSSALTGVIEKYCTLAGVEKKLYRSFHSLRRSFASELSAAGVPLPTISQMLGHKNIDEARPYLSYNRPQTLFCAMGFDGIPISGGIYATMPLSLTPPKGGGGE